MRAAKSFGKNYSGENVDILDSDFSAEEDDDMERDSESAFEIMRNYRIEKLKELSSRKKRKNEEQEEIRVCSHQEVQTHEHFVCCKCGLILGDIYCP